MAIEIIAILILLVINGIFSMSELAVVSARKARLQQRANEGSRHAQAALALANEPGPFLSTVQVGITLVGILAGAFGGASISARIAPMLADLPVIGVYSKSIAFTLVIIVITYLSLVIGELIPKRLALSDAESIAARIALPMGWLAWLCTPLVKLLDGSTNALLRVFGLHEAAEHPVTEEEIKVMIEQGIAAGVFVETERKMIERVFHLADRRVSELMIPRTDMIWLDVDDAPAEIREIIANTHHSRFPVVQGSPDNVLGIVRAKDLLAQQLTEGKLDLRAVLQPALFVPESTLAFKLLESFRQSQRHSALVIDEFGGVEGLVTINDLLVAIVGELPALGEAIEQPIVRREDGSYLLDGALPIHEFQKLFQLKTLPGAEDGDYQTLGGFIITQLGRLPVVNDRLDWHELRLEIVDMDRRRVDKVLVTPQAKNS